MSDQTSVSAGVDTSLAMTEEDEMAEVIRQHILWGIERAVREGDVEGIVTGSLKEVAELTRSGGRAKGIKLEALTRKLVPPTKEQIANHAFRNRTKPVSFNASEYLLLCYQLGISTNPYVKEDHDPLHGKMVAPYAPNVEVHRLPGGGTVIIEDV